MDYNATSLTIKAKRVEKYQELFYLLIAAPKKREIFFKAGKGQFIN